MVTSIQSNPDVSWVEGQGFVYAPGAGNTPSLGSYESAGEGIVPGVFSGGAKPNTTAPTPTIFPTPIPPRMAVAAPTIAPSGWGNTPVAQGAELMFAMLDATMRAEQLRQHAIDQTVDIAKLFAEFERVSPTRAADLAVALGMPQMQPDFGWTSRFSNEATTGLFGGKVGTQNVKLPMAFSGRELSFFGQNKNAASVIADIADRFGRPDLFNTSQGALLPTSQALSFGALG